VTSLVRRLGVVLAVAFRADARLAAIALALSVAGSTAGPLTAVCLKAVVDAARTGQQSTALFAAAALSCSWVVSIAAGHASSHVSYALEVRVIRHLVTELMRVSGRVPSIEMHERPDVVDRVELLRRESKPFAFAMTSIVWTVGILTRLTATVIVLVGVHPALAVLPLLGVPSLVTGGWAQKLRQQAQETVEAKRLSDHLLELGTTPEPGKEIRIFGLAAEITGRHARLRRTIQQRERQAEVRGVLAETLGWLAFAARYVAAIVLVTLLAVDGRATVGDVLLVIALSGQIQGQLGSAVALIGQFLRTLRAAERYLWLRACADRAAAGQPTGGTVPDRITEGIRLEGVSFRYPGTDLDVLHDIDLAIPAGASVAIVGVNGAGKTTLAKLLAGLYQPTRGRITIDGTDLSDLDPARWRRRLSACFQDFVHFQYTARESVGLGDLPRIHDEPSIRDAVQRASAADVTAALPDGLATLLGTEYGDGIELSVGQWQKIALGRHYALRPAPAHPRRTHRQPRRLHRTRPLRPLRPRPPTRQVTGRHHHHPHLPPLLYRPDGRRRRRPRRRTHRTNRNPPAARPNPRTLH
jgi:ATP-binding cassette subfamily B protein